MDGRFGVLNSDASAAEADFSPENLHARLTQVRESIKRTCISCGRDPNSVVLIGVSKTKPLEALEAAARLGLRDFGENYIQEAKAKAEKLSAVNWHLIGNIQKNKVNAAVEFATVIHSLDSADIIRRIDRRCAERGRIISGLIQVRLGREATKSGVDPENLFALLDELKTYEPRYLRLVGLMTIPPPASNPEGNRPYFCRLRELLQEVLNHKYSFWAGQELSMGMSGDYNTAIEEGATFVRVGRAVFGSRKTVKQSL
ncbi:MAG: YggS family pyridoxal phosphate-dependent enzyme [Candidatus Bruticola sp.]